MKPRKTPSGKYELQLRHKALPKGRRYYTFDTEAEALDFVERWRLVKLTGQQLPAEMLQPEPERRTLGLAIREWANSGLAAPTEQVSLGILMSDVGAVPLASLSYKWAEQFVRDCKVKRNLAPSTVRQRVHALSHAIDHFLRQHPEVTTIGNPLKLLPKGYSTYSKVDRELAEATGGRAKVDRVRDRRLHPGEYEAICKALSGHQAPDRQRPLGLQHGNAMLALFQLIHYTGLRLKEALTLTRGQVDMEQRIIRAQSSKLWRGRVGYRDVPIRKELHAALKAYLDTRALLPGAYLFPMMDEAEEYREVGRRVSWLFATAFRYAGCENLTEHDLRHEATCQWFELRDGTGNWLFRPEEINRIMGWTQGSTMAQRYASFRAQDFVARLAAAGS
jgi:integrase